MSFIRTNAKDDPEGENTGTEDAPSRPGVEVMWMLMSLSVKVVNGLK
jgi:hypothetical protein